MGAAAAACLGRLSALGSHAAQCTSRRGIQITTIVSAKRKGGGGGGGGKLERVDRLLSRLGYCPRVQAKQWVSRGRVTRADGTFLTRHDEKVPIGDLLIDDEPPECPQGLVALMHKPAGRVCSHDEREGPSVYGEATGPLSSLPPLHFNVPRYH